MALSGAGGGPLNPDARVPTLFGPALTFADRLAAADILPDRFAALAIDLADVDEAWRRALEAPTLTAILSS